MVAADGTGDYVIIRGDLLMARLTEELGDGRSSLGTELCVVTPTFVSLDASTTRGGSVVFGGGVTSLGCV